MLQTIRRLLIRPECFRLEREFAGLGFHQGEQCTLPRHTQQYRRALHPSDSTWKKKRIVRRVCSGGERWAVLASLINTAKLHDIDPETYLADVLDRIVSGRTKVNALSELLPWNWKAAREAPAAAAA